MALSERKDPYKSYRFLVEVHELVVGGFSDASGLQAETQVEEYREGGVNDYIHQLPKETKYSRLTLKRGITDSGVMWEWYRKVINGIVDRKNIYVILLDDERKEKWRWHFANAFPVKWVGPDFKADGSSVAFETIELVHDGMSKA